MKIKKHIKLVELNKSEALRYLGYGNHNPDDTIRNLLDCCETELVNVANPNFIYEAFDLQVHQNGIALNNTNVFLEGSDIKKHLFGCEKAILLCATLSLSVDKLIGFYQVKDLNKALILDSLASTAIEQVCDMAQESIQEEYHDYYSTWRFGIGYGDLSIDICHTFLETLNASKHIGLYANESNLLIPRKSVACIIGLSKNELQNNKKSCIHCNMKNTCTFRRKGERCEF